MSFCSHSLLVNGIHLTPDRWFRCWVHPQGAKDFLCQTHTYARSLHTPSVYSNAQRLSIRFLTLLLVSNPHYKKTNTFIFAADKKYYIAHSLFNHIYNITMFYSTEGPHFFFSVDNKPYRVYSKIVLRKAVSGIR